MNEQALQVGTIRRDSLNGLIEKMITSDGIRFFAGPKPETHPNLRIPML